MTDEQIKIRACQKMNVVIRSMISRGAAAEAAADLAREVRDDLLAQKKVGVHNLKGFAVVLAQVRNVYPIEETDVGTWQWGFKFVDGFYETFDYKTEDEALAARIGFIQALAAFHA